MPETKTNTPQKSVMPHNVILEGRQNLMLSGIQDVPSFDEFTVIALSSMGEITIKGEQLHISKLNLDSGELSVEGKIDSFSYSEQQDNQGGFLSKLFR
jgi:sporulation protein YabP